MGTPLKRVNTFSELFESEKNYVRDLNLWAKTFRRLILTTDCLSPQRRLVINRGLFANIDNIVELHTQIVYDMAVSNEECRMQYVLEHCIENGLLFDDVWNSVPMCENLEVEKKDGKGAHDTKDDDQDIDDDDEDNRNKNIERDILDEKLENTDHENEEEENYKKYSNPSQDTSPLKIDKEIRTSKNLQHSDNLSIISRNTGAIEDEKGHDVSNRFFRGWSVRAENVMRKRMMSIHGQTELKMKNEKDKSKITINKKPKNEQTLGLNDPKYSKKNSKLNLQDEKTDFDRQKRITDKKENESPSKEESEKKPTFTFFRGDIYQCISASKDFDAHVYASLCYHSIYEKYLKSFDIYRHYIHKMPRMQHLVGREVQINPPFVSMMADFFAQHDVRLGYLNFIFRPSQKLTRYPLLLKNVKKYAIPDNDEMAYLKNKISKINEIKKSNDRNIEKNEDLKEKEKQINPGDVGQEKKDIPMSLERGNNVYKILFEAINKNPENFEEIVVNNANKVRDSVDRITAYLSDKSKEADIMLKDGNNQFEMYKLFLHTEYDPNVHPRIGLSLFLRERKKIKEMDNVLVRSERHYEPKYFTILVMDHIFLICDVIDQGFYKRYYVIDHPLAACKWDVFVNTGIDDPENIYFRSQFSLVIREIDGDGKIFFYFNDEKQCNDLYISMNYAIEITRGRYDKRIGVAEIGEMVKSNDDDEIREMIITDFLYAGMNINRDDEDRLEKYMNEVELFYNNSEEGEDSNYNSINESVKDNIYMNEGKEDVVFDEIESNNKNISKEDNNSLSIHMNESLEKNSDNKQEDNEINKKEISTNNIMNNEKRENLENNNNKNFGEERKGSENSIHKGEIFQSAINNDKREANENSIYHDVDKMNIEDGRKRIYDKTYNVIENNDSSSNKSHNSSIHKDEEPRKKNTWDEDVSIPSSFVMRKKIIEEIVNQGKYTDYGIEARKKVIEGMITIENDKFVYNELNVQNAENEEIQSRSNIDEQKQHSTTNGESNAEKFHINDHKNENIHIDNKYLLEEGECLSFDPKENHTVKIDYRKENNKTILRESKRFQMELFKKKTPRNDNFFLSFFVTPRGIFMKNRSVTTHIYRKEVTYIFYIRERQIICFLEDSILKYAKVGYDIHEIYPTVIASKIYRFFYGKSQGKELLIVSLNSSVSSSFLHLYELKIYNEIICFELGTMLYIGGEIQSLQFYGDKILTCCMEVDIIDLKTLRVQSMLDSTDIALKMFGIDFIKTRCLNVFRVRSNVYLIVNDRVGFIVDEYGCIFDRTLYFVWYDIPTDFKLFDKYLMVLNEKSCVIYDSETGWIVAYIPIPKLRFVKGCSYVWIHDNSKVYEIDLPGILTDEKKF